MFNSYSLTEFGEQLKLLRNTFNLTQSIVSKKTNIHVDTLRKIENGFAIPRYETLELLSQLYHTDLLKVLQEKRINKDLKCLYEKLDELQINNEKHSLESLLNEISIMLTTCNNFKLINALELEYFRVFIDASRLFNSNDKYLHEGQQLLINSLAKHKSNFSINTLNDFHYLDIELRLLSLLSAFNMRIKNIKDAIIILKFLNSYINKLPLLDNYSKKMLLKIFYNLSYCHHLNDDHSNALEYSNRGIDFALKNDLIYMLPNLFARKAIAEKVLLLPNSDNSCRKCLCLLEIGSQSKLLAEYEDIFINTYGFNCIVQK